MNEVFVMPHIHKLSTGVLFEILKTTEDPLSKSPGLSDNCQVSYVSSYKNGTVFENNTKERKPEDLIEGWKQALQLMAEGSKSHTC
jgi:FKBP-type peptidyl-prolyl cis-trans isomerase